MGAGLLQRSHLGVLQRLGALVQAAGVFQARPQAQFEEPGGQFVVLGVGGVGVLGHGPATHGAGEAALVVRRGLVQPLPVGLDQAGDGRADDQVRRGRVLKLADSGVGQGHPVILMQRCFSVGCAT